MSHTEKAETGLSSAVTRVLVGYNSAAALQYSHIDARAVPTLLVDNSPNRTTIDAATLLGYASVSMGYNAGYSRAVNRGLREAATEYVLIANPDLRIDVGSIGALLDAARHYPDADVFVPRLFKPDGAESYRPESRLERRQTRREPPDGDACIPMISGAALLVRRQPFLDAGGFDENIFLYFEDDDIGLRWRARRRPIILVSAARAEHLGDESSTPSPSAARIKFRSCGWSWGYLIKKHQQGSVAGALAATAGKMVVHALSLNAPKTMRDVHIISGLLLAERGKPAPFPEPEPQRPEAV